MIALCVFIMCIFMFLFMVRVIKRWKNGEIS